MCFSSTLPVVAAAASAEQLLTPSTPGERELQHSDPFRAQIPSGVPDSSTRKRASVRQGSPHLCGMGTRMRAVRKPASTCQGSPHPCIMGGHIRAARKSTFMWQGNLHQCGKEAPTSVATKPASVWCRNSHACVMKPASL